MTPTIRRSPLLDFMEEHYEILPPAPITGKFRIENSPWLAEPMHALCDPVVRESTLMFAAQGGKNLVSEGFISYVPIYSPGNVLFYGQTDDDAETFARTRALKRAKEITILKSIWPDFETSSSKDAKAADKYNQVMLGHMMLEFLGASRSNIEGKSAPFIICDEKHLKLWKGLGDIVKKRCSAFWDHKILNISTAGDEDSEIDLDYHRGSMEDWHLGCPACHGLVKLVWSEDTKCIVWFGPDEEVNQRIHPHKGKWNFRELRKNARFQCPHCNCEERDSFPLKKEMNRLGGYVVCNPDAPEQHRSFHCSSIAYPWVNWEQLVEEWIHAQEQMKTGDLSLLKNFVIRSMGETWKRRAGNASTANITGGYSITDTVFHWLDDAGNQMEKERFATVDVQARGGRHFWCVVRAWAGNGASRFVYAYRCESWDEVERRTEENGCFEKNVGVDSRHATEEVKEMCAKKGWRYMVADETRQEYEWPVPGRPKLKVKRPFKKSDWRDTRRTQPGQKQFANGIIFSKTWARSVLANRISGQGTEWGLPDDIRNLVFKGTAKLESSYLAQLNSWVEKEVEDKKSGEKKIEWVMVNTDDHLRACEEMQLVLAGWKGYVPSELSPVQGN